MASHPSCEACLYSPATDCHHIVRRGAGGRDETGNFLALCRLCHGLAHDQGDRWFFTTWAGDLADKGRAARAAHGKRDLF